MDHAVPFHCSTRGLTNVVPGPLTPTATQKDGPAHDTPYNWLSPAPVALGLVTTVQAVPFHCSIKVLLPVLVAWSPTVTQKALLTHVTLKS
jgi:hypothetical protein